MKKVLSLVCVLSGWLLMASCSSSGSKEEKHPKMASVGQLCELLLVVDSEVQNSDVLDSLENMLTSSVEGLNQSEDFFRLSRIHISSDKGETKKMHSRLVARIDKKVKEVTTGVAYDVNCTPQVQVQLTAPSVDALRSYLPTHADYIRYTLLDNQLLSHAAYLRTHHSQQLIKDLADLGYTIDAPEEVKFTKKGKDFLWASSRSNEKQLNMVFYTRPYYSNEMPDARALAMLRDSVMMENIPGSQPDQWMETTWEQDQPIVLATPRKLQMQNAQGEYEPRDVTEMRGLWQMRNGAMGGPFISLTFIDSVKHQLVVAEGFVFSPSTPKRDLVRRLEAALRTFRKK